MSVATISGAVSGLDTATLINQLVSVQQNQQTLLQQQQADVQKRSDAYTAMSSALTTLSTQAADLANTSAWAGATATSSSTNVTATASGTKAASLTFDVAAVAAAHTLISSNSLSSMSSLAASGPLTVTHSDGTTATIDVGSGSLTDVVAAINNSSSGLVAAAVQTGPGAYRLQVASAGTGSASSFTLDGLDGFSSMDVLTQGADAKLHLGGTSSAAYDVTSSSNTFDSLVPGLSFTVGKVESGVTVASTVDGTAIAGKVNTLVTTANNILNSIATNTAYDASTKTGGALVGDSTVRSLQQNILSLVSSVGAPGVDVTRDGRITFDQAAFLTAFKADPAKVASAFGLKSTFAPSTGASSSSVTVTGALKSSRGGTYAVQVNQLAQQESWQVDPGSSDLSGQTIQLTRGSSTVSYTVSAGQTLDQVASAFNDVSSAAKFGVTAKVVDSTLQFTADAYGSSAAFTATTDGAATSSKLTAGTDVAGSIDGQTAIGLGNGLSLPTGTGGAVGVSLSVSTTQSDLDATGGAIGSVSYTPGLAQQLLTLVDGATNTQTGSLTTATSGAQTEIKRYQDEIDAWDTRLSDYRTSLTTQFTAMETALASLKTQSSAISSLLSSSSTTSSSGTLSTG